MSLLPTPYEFENQYEDDEELAAELPDRPITSLRDLQYLYGRLYTLATTGGGEYASYLTPEKSTDLFDEPESLAILRVDLSGDEPRLDPEQPVRFRTYTRDLVGLKLEEVMVPLLGRLFQTNPRETKSTAYPRNTFLRKRFVRYLIMPAYE